MPMSLAIWLWLIFLSAMVLANFVFLMVKECTIIRYIMSRTFSRKFSDKEKDDILRNMDTVIQLRGMGSLDAYLDEVYPGEFSGTNRERRSRLKKLNEIQFTTFLIDFAEDLGGGLDFIFHELGPALPLYRTPKIKK